MRLCVAISGLIFLALSGAALAASNKTQDQRRAAQEIYYSAAAEPVSLDPTKQVDGSSSSWLGHMFEGLMTHDQDGKLVPGSAERYEASADKKVWTFWIRKNAQWHDGKAVSAKDFEFAFKRLVDPQYASVYAFIAMTAGMQNADAIIAGKLPKEQLGVKALDDVRLQVTLDKPVVYFDELMSFQSFYPVRQDLVEKYGSTFAIDPASVIGNGPFKMAHWEKEHSLRIEKAANYWNAAAITITAIESPSMIKDAQADYNNYATKGLDYLSIRTPEVVAQAQAAKQKLIPFANGCVSFFALNVKPGRPFADRALRLALRAGIDRKEFVNKIVGLPGNKPAYHFLPDYLPGAAPGSSYRKDVPIPFKDHDIAEAQAQLDEYKKRTGNATMPKFTILTTDSTTSRKYGEYWQNAFQKLMKTEVKIENLPLKAMTQRERDLDFDISLTGWCPDYMDAMTFADFHTGTNDNNFTGWANAEHDKLIAEAGRETDPKKRIALFAAAEKIYLADAPSVPYYESGSVYMTAPGLEGVRRGIIGISTDFRFAHWKPVAATGH